MRLTIGWRIFLTVAAVNALYIHSFIGNPMSASMLDLTVSLVDRGRLDIDPYAGNSLDVARRGEHYFSGLAPGVSIAAVPSYLAAKAWLPWVATPERERAVDAKFLAVGTSWRPSEKRLTILLLDAWTCAIGSSALAGMMAVLFHRALVLIHPDLDRRRRLLTTWLFAFGTLWFYYSPTLEHRTLSTFFCFVAFLGLLRLGQDASIARRNAAIVGLALGSAVATTYEVALVGALILAFGLARWGRDWPWGWTMLGGLAIVIPLGVYHTICFGAPLVTPYSVRAFPLSGPTALRPGWRRGGGLTRALDLLFGNRYGVFFYSPILLLALFGLKRLRRGDPLAGVTALAWGTLAVLLAFHYATGYDGTPGEFGSRFLLPSVPFLMLLVPLSFRRCERVVVPALSAATLVIVGKGLMFGAARSRLFWGDYPELLGRYGLANYTLSNLKDHVWPALSPWAITAIHAAALATVLALVRGVLWRGQQSDRDPTLTSR